MFDGIGAELVWDGTHEIHIPERMGKPLEGQMEGTPAELLTELSGRICYDSLGSKRSRPSGEYVNHSDLVSTFRVLDSCNLDERSAEQRAAGVGYQALSHGAAITREECRGRNVNEPPDGALRSV